jgi:hypothetical protein
LEALIAQLMSPDNPTRGAAESTYNSWKGQAPDALFAAVMQVLMNSSREEARSTCIVLLRSLITSSKDSVWDKIDPVTRKAVCSELLVAVVNESSPVLRHKLNLLVAEVGAKLSQLGMKEREEFREGTNKPALNRSWRRRKKVSSTISLSHHSHLHTAPTAHKKGQWQSYYNAHQLGITAVKKNLLTIHSYHTIHTTLTQYKRPMA